MEYYIDPEPDRLDESAQLPNTHVIAPDDSVWSITRRYNQSGSAWREMYEIPQNTLIIGSDPTLRNVVGEILVIPNSWLEG